ncbi:MAG TPA: hypothetical protein VMV45_16345, partial [Casimicrobiaceae bacterium]|nr:hypothetical protein [Casimicrobiaceae bacterium]
MALAWLRMAVGLVLAAALACAAHAQPRFGLSADNSAQVERWLNGTCIGEEARNVTSALRSQPAVL